MWKNFNISWAWQVTIESSCPCSPTWPNPSTNFSGRTQNSHGHSNGKQPSNLSNKLSVGIHPPGPMYRKTIHIVHQCQSLCIFQHHHPGSWQSWGSQSCCIHIWLILRMQQRWSATKKEAHKSTSLFLGLTYT